MVMEEPARNWLWDGSVAVGMLYPKEDEAVVYQAGTTCRKSSLAWL